MALFSSKHCFQVQVLFHCHMLNSYSEAVAGNEILNSPAPSNNAQTICVKENHSSKKEKQHFQVFIEIDPVSHRP